MTHIDGNIQQRYDTAANFAASNRILLAGEKAIESDTLKEKVGDGSTPYNDLPYSDAELVQRMDDQQAAYQISEKDRIIQVATGGILAINDGESDLLKFSDGKQFLFSKERQTGIEFSGYFVGNGLPQSDSFQTDSDVWYAFYTDNDTDMKYLVFADRVNTTHPFGFTPLRETVERKANAGISNDDNFINIDDLTVNLKADVLYKVETYLVFESVGASQTLRTRFTQDGGAILEESLYLEATGVTSLKNLVGFFDSLDTPFTSVGDIKAFRYDGVIKLDADAQIGFEFSPKTGGHEFLFKKSSWVRFTQIG